MPADFEKCRQEGGRIRTVTGKKYGCGKGEYRRICYDDEGKGHLGEIKTKKEES